jgi:hypothetical protein
MISHRNKKIDAVILGRALLFGKSTGFAVFISE